MRTLSHTLKTFFAVLVFPALLLLLSVAPLLAQSPNQLPSFYFAANYGQWTIASQAPNTYQFPAQFCQLPQVGTASTFYAFNTNAPLYIQDSNASLSEVVTPSAVINTAGACGVTLSPSNLHVSFRLVSGTGGLQESLNVLAISTQTFPAPIFLDKAWYQLAAAVPGKTPQGIIAAAVGNQNAYLIDVTTFPWTYYSYNGTGYVAPAVVSAGGATAPTVAASTGAGTSPTIALATGASGSQGIVTLTSGTTPTASATIFTLTWPTSGSFTALPAGCTVYSVGTKAAKFTYATTFSASHAIVTVTATSSSLTASTAGYAFRYNCQ